MGHACVKIVEPDYDELPLRLRLNGGVPVEKARNPEAPWVPCLRNEIRQQSRLEAHLETWTLKPECLEPSVCLGKDVCRHCDSCRHNKEGNEDLNGGPACVDLMNPEDQVVPIMPCNARPENEHQSVMETWPPRIMTPAEHNDSLCSQRLGHLSPCVPGSGNRGATICDNIGCCVRPGYGKEVVRLPRMRL
mmetsp:Transcript_44688/g.88496  ORF Transcript_44688/g.88496 Transcript_44688/m.88496 type:complete len:191 (-) Transcript_44688:80-652(-)